MVTNQKVGLLTFVLPLLTKHLFSQEIAEWPEEVVVRCEHVSRIRYIGQAGTTRQDSELSTD